MTEEISENVLEIYLTSLKPFLQEFEDYNERVQSISETYTDEFNFWEEQLSGLLKYTERKSFKANILKPICFCMTRLEYLDPEYYQQILSRKSFFKNVTHGDLQSDEDFLDEEYDFDEDYNSCSGKVMSFGKNDYQLGFSSDKSFEPLPKSVRTEQNINFESISCSKFHTVALSKGKVFVWGNGKNGRMGLGDEKVYILPQQLNLKVRVTKVAAARDHTLALTDCHSVLSWGCNKFGQLGVGVQKNLLKPAFIPHFRGDKIHVSDIAASRSHSVCITYSKVFAWGSNSEKQLGCRSAKAIISTPIECQVDFSCLKCAANEGITLLLTYSGKVYQFGNGNPVPKKITFTSTVSDEDPSGWSQSNSKQPKIEEISAGPLHCAAVSRNGSLYTWGAAADLLGYSKVGNERSSKSHFQQGVRVNSLKKMRRHIVSVSCSKRHTCAIDLKGCCWVWGHGDHGVLGLSDSITYQPEPRIIPGLKGVFAVSSSEAQTSVIIAENSIAVPEYKKEPLEDIVQREMMTHINLWNVLSEFKKSTMLPLKMYREACEQFIVKNLHTLVIVIENFLPRLCDILGVKSYTASNTNLLSSKFFDLHVTPYPPRKKSFAQDSTPTKESSKTKTRTESEKKKKIEVQKENIENLICRLCDVTVPDNRAMAEHVSGKKHRKKFATKSHSVKRVHFEEKKITSVTSSPQIEPKSPMSFLSFDESEFPKPLPGLTTISPRRKSSIETSSPPSSSRATYSLTDLIESTARNKLKNKNATKIIKASPWKVVKPNVLSENTSFDAIMNVQKRESSLKSKERVEITNSSWGLTLDNNSSLAEIQAQQREQAEMEKLIAEQLEIEAMIAKENAKAKEKAAKGKKKNYRRRRRKPKKTA